MFKRVPAVLRICGAVVLIPAVVSAAPAEREAAMRAFIDAPANHVINTRRENGAVQFIGASPSQPIPETSLLRRPEDRARAFLKSKRDLFVDPTTPLELVTTRVQDNAAVGISHVRFQQVFHGIPVRSAEAVVRLNAEGITAISSKLISTPMQLATTPLVSGDAAANTAQSVVLKKYGPVPATLSVPRLEILDVGIFHGQSGQPQLTWFITAGGDALYERIWINAVTGALAYSYSQFTDARNRRVFDANNGSIIPVVPARSEALSSTPSGVPDVDNGFNFVGDFWDYFYTVLGRDSYDGQGAALNSIVRYCNNSTGCPFKGAYWDGTLSVQKIFLGAGYATDDVIAHELTHAVIDYTSNLIYSGESGALNESYADIFGETIDLWKDYGDDTLNVRWMIGEELSGYAGTGIRSLRNPALHGQPERVSDSSYLCTAADNFGVHQNSGVPNHAYALMVDGGSYNGYTINGIGLTKAAKIQYHTLLFLPEASRFVDNFDGLNQACSELIGKDGLGITHDDCAQVKKAALAVEMTTTPCQGAVPPAPPGAPPLPVAAVPGQCPVGQVVQNFFADDFENTTSGNWVTAAASGTNHWLGGTGNPSIYFSTNPASGNFALYGKGGLNASDSSVMMKNDVIVPAKAFMQFSSSYDFETAFDGSVIEYSVDAGSSWQDAGALIKYGRNYDGVLVNGVNNSLGGRAAFTGHTGGAYVDSQLDLNPLAGRNVRFRFHMSTDNLVASPGIWIDTLSIFTCAATTGGVVFTPAQGLRTTEAGGSANFNVVLRTAPTADVVLTFASSNVREGTVSPAVVTFTPLNWNVPKTVAVTGVDDVVDDNDAAYAITTRIVSADSSYNGLVAPGIDAINVDNDDAGLLTTPASGLVTTEAGGKATFTVALKSRPLTDVTLNFTSSDNREGMILGSSETFTPANWNQARTITFKGIDDNVIDGNVAYFVAINVSSLDSNYASLGVLKINAVNADNDGARFVVTPADGLTTSEMGSKATFLVRLASKPSASVLLNIASSNLGEATVAPAALTFQSANWDIPQPVTVTGVDDAVLDGDVPYTIILRPAVSNDVNYNGLDAPDITLVNLDNDKANIVVMPGPDLYTTESGGTATFSLVLTKAPAGNVSIELSSSNPAEGMVNRSTIIFTASNWNKPTLVTVTGVDDNTLDGDVLYSIVTSPAISGDVVYNGMNAPDAFLVNRNNDVAEVIVSPAAQLITTEDKKTATFSVSLAKQPNAGVSMSFTSSNPAEGKVTTAPLLFTTANWNIPQTVTVTGQDDNIADGDVRYDVSIDLSASDDPGYRVLAPLSVGFINRDNENQSVQQAGGTPAMLINAGGALITTEDAGAATFTVTLNHRPLGDVYISLASSNKSEGTVHPETLSFTTADWDKAKTVRVIGVNDNTIDGDVNYFITLTVDAVNSQDFEFAALAPTQMKVINKDNDKVASGALSGLFLVMLLVVLIQRRRCFLA